MAAARTAIAAIEGASTARPLPLRKMPRRMSTKYVNGRRYEIHRSHTGILRSGKMKPVKRKVGISMKIDDTIACCCVLETAEARMPMPSVANRYTRAIAPKSTGFPSNGTPNHATARAVITNASKRARVVNGSILPSRSSVRVSGVTMSCSSVPRSRSLTIAVLVRIIEIYVMMRPTRPGIMKLTFLSSGLKTTRARVSMVGTDLR
jgi:hypothetical protein